MQSKLLFVVFVGLLLQTEVLSKPYQSLDVPNSNEQWFEARENPRQKLNETSPSREKRQVMTFKELCRYEVDSTYTIPPSNLPCVERIFYCPAHDLTHYICKRLDFSCLSSIARTSFPSCVPSWSEVGVMYMGNERKVEITTGCTCA